MLGVQKRQTGQSIMASSYGGGASLASVAFIHRAWPVFQGHQHQPSRPSSLQRRHSGWPTPEPLTLHAKQHVLLHILSDGNTERGWDLYLLNIVIHRGIQCLLAPSSLLTRTIQPLCQLQRETSACIRITESTC